MSRALFVVPSSSFACVAKQAGIDAMLGHVESSVPHEEFAVS
jgi:hypothetical protein